jgi:hypothetical protein
MPIDYLAEFPIPVDRLPARLRDLLTPVGLDPAMKVTVADRFEHDPHGPEREHLLLISAVVPEDDLADLGLLGEASRGLVEFSTPAIDQKGELGDRRPSVSGYGYIVAAWGDNSWFGFNLAEAVWMTLGLTPRCVGNDTQQLVYDDLSEPNLGIAEGEVSSAYYYTSQRNVRWRMRNDYLRRYLWMRGAWAVRAFYYQALLPDVPELRALMQGEPNVVIAPEGGWFDLDLREAHGGLLLQLDATVAAVSPEKCEEPTSEGLVWPGFEGPVTGDIANALVGSHFIHLDDRFLERYEQDAIFDSRPAWIHDRWFCSPSYRGQWSFTDCVRVGRNIVRVPLRELYKPKPDPEILHARSFALTPEHVATFDLTEEPIVGKVQRLTEALLILAEGLSWLAHETVGSNVTPDQIFKLSRDELRRNGWLAYPELCRLGQVAPLAMTQQAFLARCKSLFELLNRLPTGLLRQVLEAAGHRPDSVKSLGSLKLLQALLNQLLRMNNHLERANAFIGGADAEDLKQRNADLAGLFISNDLRLADAHDIQEGLPAALNALGLDQAELNQGYGRALDVVFDAAILGVTAISDALIGLSRR